MMIDDLDLGFDEPDDKGRHRRGQKAARKKRDKGTRGRSIMALLVTLLLLGGLGFGGYLGYQAIAEKFTTPDYEGQGIEETVQVDIRPGATQVDIAKALKAADVIKSEKAFIESGNADALKIQPGVYKLRKHMSGKAAVAAMLDLKNRIVNGVTIPEGLITLEIYDILAKELKLKVEDFKAAAADPVKLGIPEWWFNRKDGVAPTTPRSLEGFLFPATYEFPPNITADGALKVMVNHFLTVTGKLRFADRVQAERHISPYEALVTASIVEGEVQKAEDMGKAARAIYNRAYTDKADTKLLQVDAAFNYQFKLEGKDPKHSNDLKQSEMQNPNNPYNTYKRPGLTPTPIGNPGENALKAAMDPPVGNWLYWVTVDAQGTTLFADTLSQHDNNRQVGCRNGFLTTC